MFFRLYFKRNFVKTVAIHAVTLFLNETTLWLLACLTYGCHYLLLYLFK